jgi:uncharacterized protein (DUF433 family)
MVSTLSVERRRKTMLEAKIIDRGRGPEIAGTRITVYDVLDYHQAGRHRDMIADTLELSSQQVEVAIRYIEEHRDEVTEGYNRILARHARGNPPELQSKVQSARKCIARTNRPAGIGWRRDIGAFRVPDCPFHVVLNRNRLAIK